MLKSVGSELLSSPIAFFASKRCRLCHFRRHLPRIDISPYHIPSQVSTARSPVSTLPNRYSKQAEYPKFKAMSRPLQDSVSDICSPASGTELFSGTRLRVVGAWNLGFYVLRMVTVKKRNRNCIASLGRRRRGACPDPGSIQRHGSDSRSPLRRLRPKNLKNPSIWLILLRNLNA